MKVKYAVGALLAVLLGASVLSGCVPSDADDGSVPDSSRASGVPTSTEPTPTATPTGTTTSVADPSTSAPEEAESDGALAALAALAVKGRAPMTGYDRARFGQAWLDADRNGCDTRNDVLASHLTVLVVEGNGCVVATGRYADPYTGADIDYVHGDGYLIDIDHVVALGNAWATGAAGWDVKERAALANDPLNLLPADAGANRQKGDGDAATWLPSNKPFRCAYVARQVAVKQKYGLWVTGPEKDAITRVLSGCPGEPLPFDVTKAPIRVDHDITDPGAPQPSPAQTATTTAP